MREDAGRLDVPNKGGEKGAAHCQTRGLCPRGKARNGRKKFRWGRVQIEVQSGARSRSGRG